jgi:metal-sulfur cluster biosynthetic enzyme
MELSRQENIGSRVPHCSVNPIQNTKVPAELHPHWKIDRIINQADNFASTLVMFNKAFTAA